MVGATKVGSISFDIDADGNMAYKELDKIQKKTCHENQAAHKDQNPVEDLYTFYLFGKREVFHYFFLFLDFFFEVIGFFF